MDKYKILRKKVFESNDKFDERLNETARQGWRAISISETRGALTVLLEKEH